jgi:hypothetical protein
VSRPFLARCAVVTVALVGLPWAGTVAGNAVTGPERLPISQQPDSEPLEDEPGWDCRTMGNGECGPSIDTSTCGPIGNPLGCPTWAGDK